MLEFEEVSNNLQRMKLRLLEIGDSLNIFELEEELKELEKLTMMQGFWNDTAKSSVILKKINTLKLKTEQYKKINNNLIDIIELIEILKIDYDEDLENELVISIKKIEKEIEKLEINTLLSGKYDINNAIITLHPRCGWNRKL